MPTHPAALALKACSKTARFTLGKAVFIESGTALLEAEAELVDAGLARREGDVLELTPLGKTAGYIENWLILGRLNPWVREATDPPFNEDSFGGGFESIEALKAELVRASWCLGQAFFYDDVCFINQVDGGDEWLVIRRNVPFESLTASLSVDRGHFEDFIARIQRATPEQLKSLEY